MHMCAHIYTYLVTHIHIHTYTHTHIAQLSLTKERGMHEIEEKNSLSTSGLVSVCVSYLCAYICMCAYMHVHVCAHAHVHPMKYSNIFLSWVCSPFFSPLKDQKMIESHSRHNFSLFF